MNETLIKIRLFDLSDMSKREEFNELLRPMVLEHSELYPDANTLYPDVEKYDLSTVDFFTLYNMYNTQIFIIYLSDAPIGEISFYVEGDIVCIHSFYVMASHKKIPGVNIEVEALKCFVSAVKKTNDDKVNEVRFNEIRIIDLPQSSESKNSSLIVLGFTTIQSLFSIKI